MPVNIGQIEKCINSLAFKFIENPYNFFTEADLHSYLYYFMLRSGSLNLKVQYQIGTNTNIKQKTVLLHREYPTFFRYTKKDLKNYTGNNPWDFANNFLLNNKGGRGHYDFVILNDKFISKYDFEFVRARNYEILKSKLNLAKPISPVPFTAAIEFKYLINNSKNILEEVELDFKKLSLTKGLGHAETIYMLIFVLLDNDAKGKDIYKKVKDYYQSNHPYLKVLLVFVNPNPETKKSSKYRIFYSNNQGSWNNRINKLSSKIEDLVTSNW